MLWRRALDQVCACGGFVDCYFRGLPPLRRRGDDIELLTDHLLAEACAEEGKQVGLSQGARLRLKGYAWPGNVRQLKALVRRVVILAEAEQEVGEAELELDEGRAP